MSDVEYSIVDQWYRLLNNEMAEHPTGFDLSADLIGNGCILKNLADNRTYEHRIHTYR